MKKTYKTILFIIILLNFAFMNCVCAEDINLADRIQDNLTLNEENTAYWEDVFNTGHDNGFSEKKE